jgi:2-(1,2-epoxy-1,2-dihydrophenyl)acetyl-CoA isomerase
MSDTVLVDLVDGVSTVTLNRPDKLNAFTDEMLHALLEALRRAERSAETRCVVITGAGRAFSAGQDLGAVRERAGSGPPDFRGHLEHTYNRVIRSLRGVEKPVVAAVNGVAAGAGASIALACDLRIAAESATLIQSFIGVGLVPDSGATWVLPRTVGLARAFELAITAERLSAADALACGLVNRVVPDDEFGDAVREYASRLAAAPTKAIGLTKRAMNRAMTSTLDEALDYEARLQDIAGRTRDHAEGVSAFLEKRPPSFEGR